MDQSNYKSQRAENNIQATGKKNGPFLKEIVHRCGSWSSFGKCLPFELFFDRQLLGRDGGLYFHLWATNANKMSNRKCFSGNLILKSVLPATKWDYVLPKVQDTHRTLSDGLHSSSTLLFSDSPFWLGASEALKNAKLYIKAAEGR